MQTARAIVKSPLFAVPYGATLPPPSQGLQLIPPAAICTAILRNQPDAAEFDPVVQAFRAYEKAYRNVSTPEGHQHALALMRDIPEQYLAF